MLLNTRKGYSVLSMDQEGTHSTLIDVLRAEVKDFQFNGGFPKFLPGDVDLLGLIEEGATAESRLGSRVRRTRKYLDTQYESIVAAVEEAYGSAVDATTVLSAASQGSPSEDISQYTNRMDSAEARLNWQTFTGNVASESGPIGAQELMRPNDPLEKGVPIRLSQNASALWRKNKATAQNLISVDNISGAGDAGPGEEGMGSSSMAEFLKIMPVFQKVSLGELASYEDQFTMKSVMEVGEIILERGQVPDCLYVIRRGSIGEGLVQDFESSVDFVEHRKLGVYDFFGALPSDSGDEIPSAKDYRVVAPALIVTVPRRVIGQMFDAEGGFLSNVSQAVSIEHASLSDYMLAFRDALDILDLALDNEPEASLTPIAPQEIGNSEGGRRSSLQSTHVLRAVKATGTDANGQYALHKLSSSKPALALELVTIHRPELNFVDTIQHILRLVEDFFRVERVGFFLVDQESDPWKLELLVSQNDSGTSLPLAGISGHVVRTGEIVNIEDCYEDERFDPSMDLKTGFKTTQMIALPVLGHDGTVRGVLQLINSYDNMPFGKDQVSLLSLVTDHLENLMSSMRSIGSVFRVPSAGKSASALGSRHISISDINKPLKVHIRSAALDKVPDDIKEKEVCYLQITMALYHGYTQYGKTSKTSHRKRIKRGFCDFHESIEIADITLSRVPLNSRLIFHLIECDASGQRIGEPLGWASVNIFTFEQVLRTGLQRFEMRQGRCLNVNESTKIEDRACEVMLELPRFGRTIVHEVPKRQTINKAAAGGTRSPETYWSQLQHEERRRLEFFLQDPLQVVQTDSDRALLWKMRYGLVVEPDFLPIWLQSVNWFNPDVVAEAYNMLYIWQNVSYTQAVQLLDGRFADSKVRAYAVQRLDELRDSELIHYLLPLVRNLRCEPFQDSSLARFLLRRSAVAPEEIGVPLLWHLLGESPQGASSPQAQAVKSTLVVVIGETRNFVRMQADFINALEEVLNSLHEGDTHEERQEALRAKLEHVFVPQDIPMVPYAPYFLADDIRSELCTLHPPVPGGNTGEGGMNVFLADVDLDHEHHPLQFSFTLGTDHRRQEVVLQSIRSIVHMFDDSKVAVSPYFFTQECLYTGDAITFTEVPDGVLMSDIIVSAPGYPLGNPSAKVEYLKENPNVLEDFLVKRNEPENMRDVRTAFAMSMAGYNVILYVLGLRNGDFSNIYLRPSGELQHVGFEQFMRGSRAKRGGPDARGKIPFFFPQVFAEVFGPDNKTLVSEYRQCAVSAFLAVRKNQALVLSNLFMFLGTGIPELNNMQDLAHIRDNFMPNKTEADAADAFVSMLDKSLVGFFTEARLEKR